MFSWRNILNSPHTHTHKCMLIILYQGAYDTELIGFFIGSVKLVFLQILISLVQEIKDKLLAKESFRVISCQYFNHIPTPWSA